MERKTDRYIVEVKDEKVKLNSLQSALCNSVAVATDVVVVVVVIAATVSLFYTRDATYFSGNL